MSLTIERFATRCRVSPRARIGRAQIEDTVRAGVVREGGRALAGWERDGAVVRIRRLKVAVSVKARDFASDRAAEIWAAALAAALRRVLSGVAGETVRAPGRAEWLGRYLAEVLAGTAAGRWEYAEFAGGETSGASAILAALARESADAPAALAWLWENGRLDSLLAAFHERELAALGVLLRGATPCDAAESGDALSPRSLAQIAVAARRHTPPQNGARLGTRRRAIRLYLALHREGGAFFAAEDLHRALLMLDALLDPAARPDAAWPAEVAAAFVTARADLREPRGNAPPSAAGTALARALAELQPRIPPPASSAENESAPWIETEAAGLFLLVDRLQHLGWMTTFSEAARERDSRSGGLRTATAQAAPERDVAIRRSPLLGGIALAILGRAGEPLVQLDPGVALFAGWVGEPDLAGFRDFLASAPTADCLAITDALLGEESPSMPADAALESIFTLLAAKLVREFAATLRAFRDPSHAFIVENFLAVAGRIRLEKDRLTVALTPNPYRIVLRIAGADSPVESVSWLGGRRLEFLSETS